MRTVTEFQCSKPGVMVSELTTDNPTLTPNQKQLTTGQIQILMCLLSDDVTLEEVKKIYEKCAPKCTIISLNFNIFLGSMPPDPLT